MSTQNTSLEEHVKIVIERLSANPKYSHLRELTFLLIGRAGVGKSSTINSLLNRPVASVGKWERVTTAVEAYRLDINGIKCSIFDTPGLCDDLVSKGNDEKYLGLMQANVPLIHCLLFVARLSDNRFGLEEKTVIELVTRKFGVEIWEHTIIVFTFANDIKNTAEFEEALRIRSELFRREISQYIDKRSKNIPCISIDNHSLTTPDGKTWRDELITAVLTRINSKGFAQFFLTTIKTIKWNTEGENPTSTRSYSTFVRSEGERIVEPPTELSKEKSEKIKRRVLGDPGIMTVLIEVGKALGSVFGLPGTASGGVAGAFLGLILWLTSKI
jgi:GTP-binding protein EngB required for normal cell division